jgi:hypothetical protein
MKRRQYLKGLGATATALAIAPSSTTASGPYREQPEYVDLVYNTSVLEEFRPLVVTRTLDVTIDPLYGWVATSAERDLNVAVYFGWRPTQAGVSEYDSHPGDREPIYVFYDPNTREIDEVVVDGYHYIATRYPASALTFTDQKHARLQAVNPWAFYKKTQEEGVYIDLGNLHNRYQTWIDNGWGVHRESVVNPWVIRRRGHWWADTVGGFSVDRAIVQAGLTLGLGGADQADV